MKRATLFLVAILAWTSPSRADEPVDYLREVKPIFTKHCVMCHGPAKQRADLRLDTAAHLMDGGNSGPALVPGKSADSRLIQALTGVKDVKQMPPDDRPQLGKPEIALLKAWIDQGAKAPPKEDVATEGTGSAHWSFKTPDDQLEKSGIGNTIAWMGHVVLHFFSDTRWSRTLKRMK